MSEARGAIALPLPSRAQQHPLRGTRPVEAGTRRLEDACAAVEGLFLSQLLSELGKPAFGGGILGTGVAHQLFSAQRNAAMGAELGRRDWAYRGSTFTDAAFGRGRTIWRFADATAPDADGWQSVAVDPDVVAARSAGINSVSLYSLDGMVADGEPDIWLAAAVAPTVRRPYWDPMTRLIRTGLGLLDRAVDEQPFGF